MNTLFEKITFLFDPLHHQWEHERMHRKISLFLVIFFIAALFIIELKRVGLLTPSLSAIVPRSHFSAIESAFTVVLILEVISLIFTLPCSFSRSVGKQFELLSLILMRNAFKELSYFPEPISFAGNEQAVLRILSDGFGALLIFALLGLYYLIQDKKQEKAMKPSVLFRFVAAKKGLALLLLIAFSFMGTKSAWLALTGTEHTDFLHDFYTLLILADVLIVLLSQCFQPGFYSVFRNSGFALSTMIIRIALAAPPFYNVLLGIAAALFAIALNLTCNNIFGKKIYRSHH
ncbi:MAG: hypothetical protein CSA26_07775 [Desulfobacterales bacterium]|nr:MAG: hypothetical protein CSA26_07775 [Desulfobacterales bacterium]